MVARFQKKTPPNSAQMIVQETEIVWVENAVVKMVGLQMIVPYVPA